MEKKKRGLQLPEVFLIILVILVGLYSMFMLLFSGNNALYLKNAFKYFLVALTFGGTKYGESAALTELFYLTFGVFYLTILGSVALGIYYLANKRGRSIVSIVDFILGSATFVFAMSFYQGNYEQITNHIVSRPTVAAMCAVVLIVLLAFVLGLLALFVGTKSAYENGQKLAGKKEPEEKVVVKEVVREVVKEVVREEPAPEPAPVKEEPKEEPKPEPEPVTEPEPEVEEKEGLKIERVPFVDKVRRSDRDLKNKYDELKEHLRSYGLKSRISIDGDSFRLHRVLYVHITIAGKKMKVYFKLDPNDYLTSPLPIRDASKVKKYADVPAQLDVKSDLSVRRAKELIDVVMENAGIEKGEKEDDED